MARTDISEMLLSQRFSPVRFVKLASTDISEMLLSPRCRDVRFVKLESVEISETLLEVRLRYVRFVKLERGEISEMLLLPRCSNCKLVACSSPVRLRMSLLGASMCVKVAISSLVIGASRDLPRLSAITARRLASAMVLLLTVLPKLVTKIRKSEISIVPLLSRSYLA